MLQKMYFTIIIKNKNGWQTQKVVRQMPDLPHRFRRPCNNDLSLISNYRPIPLLSILSKLMECHIKELPIGGLYLFQGFLPKRSTVAALLSVISSISSHADRNHTGAFFSI